MSLGDFQADIMQTRQLKHVPGIIAVKRHPGMNGNAMRILAAVLFFALISTVAAAEVESPQGMYFAKKAYEPKPLPTFSEMKDRLPGPIYDENPTYVAMYWKAWELAFRNFHEPAPKSGYVSQFIDAAFSENIFLWDTCFMTMFCNYGYPLTPGIGSLDNFYAKQYEDGEICREINRETGRDYPLWVNETRKDLFSRWGKYSVKYTGRDVPQPTPLLTLDALDHPICAWAELEHLRVTGDRSRLSLILDPLVHYYRALQKYIRQGNGLYITDWASMDNSPRIPDIKDGGTAVDTSAEMVLFAEQLATIAGLVGKKEAAEGFRKEAAELKKTINEKMWNAKRKFYFDLTVDGRQSSAKTIAGFWTLLAGVAAAEQGDALAAELRNPNSFGRRHRVPTTPADQEGFDPAGGYWRGSVWAPTNTMVIRGLERYGKNQLAREIALEHLQRIGEVFQKTGTLWENYSPDHPTQGTPAARDFVGWSGTGPILYFLEYAIGLRPDAVNNHLTWVLESAKRCGCQRYRFGGHTVTLTAEPPAGSSATWRIAAESDGTFDLTVKRGGRQWDFSLKKGTNSFSLD
jgi:hypothetical protein